MSINTRVVENNTRIYLRVLCRFFACIIDANICVN